MGYIRAKFHALISTGTSIPAVKNPRFWALFPIIFLYVMFYSKGKIRKVNEDWRVILGVIFLGQGFEFLVGLDLFLD